VSQAYGTAAWGSLFVASAGAAAALTGLVFVALSINLGRILEGPGLPQRAAETIMLLAEALFLSLVALVPMPRHVLAACLVVLGVAGWAAPLWIFVHAPRNPAVTPGKLAFRLTMLQLATLPPIVAGVSLAVGAGGGLYWLVGGVCFLLVNGITNAWILLVEIIR